MINPREAHAKLFRLSVTLFVLTSYLLGCGTTPVKTSDIDENKEEITLEQVTKLLSDAENMLPNEQQVAYISAAEYLIELGEYDWARNMLLDINEYQLDNSNYFRFAFVSAQLAIIDGNPFIAKGFLWDEKIESIYPTIDIAEQIEFHKLRARLLSDLGEFAASADERIRLNTILFSDQDAIDENHDQLWQSLMELSLTELEEQQVLTKNRMREGWYSLAILSKNNQTNLQNQDKALDQWVFSWPEHPASLRLPADLQLIKQLAADQPKRVALILPLSGKFQKPAEAILDGFMAAYYHSSDKKSTQPLINIYNSETQDIQTLYDEAVLAGAETIIGPLDKTKISELLQIESMKVPVLALNQVETGALEALPLYQFGLTIEDEAKQVAEQAWKDGHRRAMVLSPASSWGERGAIAFLDRWIELGGFVTREYQYKKQKEFSELIKNAMQVSDSQARASKIRRLLGTPIEFEPRRRQDIDFIFMISNASQARQLKPTLAFHYAGNIPVYAASHVYKGTNEPKVDRDLNNIRFTTLPWFFDQNIGEKKDIKKYTPSNNYERLYALGVDAYYLYPRLKQLDEVKQSHFYGTTGKLSIKVDRKIQRVQTWAYFENGVPIEMPKTQPLKDI